MSFTVFVLSVFLLRLCFTSLATDDSLFADDPTIFDSDSSSLYSSTGLITDNANLNPNLFSDDATAASNLDLFLPSLDLAQSGSRWDLRYPIREQKSTSFHLSATAISTTSTSTSTALTMKMHFSSRLPAIPSSTAPTTVPVSTGAAVNLESEPKSVGLPMPLPPRLLRHPRFRTYCHPTTNRTPHPRNKTTTWEWLLGANT